MLTADYIGSPLPNSLGKPGCNFSSNLEADIMDDPQSTSGTYFGLSGGCIDAPNAMSAGSTYWHTSDSSGYDMPSTFSREG